MIFLKRVKEIIGILLRYIASILPWPYQIRAMLYKISGVKIGEKVCLDRDIQITACQYITIGNRVSIAKSVSLLGSISAVHSKLEQEFPVNQTKNIVIEDDVWIGVKATIMPGVRIGKMATVGANTLVIKDVPPYATVLGVPGRIMLIKEKKENIT